MEKELSAHFDKLESAFKELIDSITTYNPSVKAAEDVLAADDELSHGLEKRKRPHVISGILLDGFADTM
jgi:hypothetical protein